MQENDPLASLRNFRDLGGVPTREGFVARGRLFRTAHLSGIDDAAAAHLVEEFAIASYVDFRVAFERERDGAPKPLQQRGVRWVHHPFDISDEIFQGLRRPTPQDWSNLYVRALARLTPQLSGAILTISRLKKPVVFGCWVGKDRTGMVAALLLSLLGVEDEPIAADYARTSSSLARFKSDYATLWKKEPEAHQELFDAYLGTPPDIMLRFLHTVRARSGSVATALGLSEQDVTRLRERYVSDAAGEVVPS